MYPILIKLSESTAARRRVPIWLVDATDGIAAETGVSGTPRISKNGAASAAASATITEVDSTNMPGLYYLELTAGEVDTLGTILISFKTAATAQWHGVAHVVAYDPYDSVRQGMTALPNAAAEAAGGLYTRGTGAGQINQPANGQIDANVAAMAAAVVTATAIATDAIGSDEFTQAAADKVWASATRNLTALGFQLGAGDIAADAIGASEFAQGAADKVWSTAARTLTALGFVLDATDLAADTIGASEFAQAAADKVFGSSGAALTELSQGVPAATPRPDQAIMLMYMALRNKLDVTSTFKEVHNDAGAVVTKKALTDDGSTYSEAEMETGP